jgi:16S rRNA (cytosine967-C5)-methyltransferase
MVKQSANNNRTSRQLAVKWLGLVLNDGRSINDILSRQQMIEGFSSSDIAFAKQILFGGCRYFHQIKAILDQLLEKPLKQKDQDVYLLLIIGVYQLRYMSVPDHAAISETVELTKVINKPWAKGLVNGCLRNYQRQLDNIETKLSKAKTFLHSHPNWIIRHLESDWLEQAAEILQQNNQRAPMTIRVNTLRVARDEYLSILAQNSIEAVPHPIARDALVLDKPCDVYQLPGFESGDVTVQDAAAQLAVELLDLKPNLRVLDGCAAPGGKTTHILQREPTTQLVSVEMSELRSERIRQTLDRLDMQCQLKTADILNHSQWWDGQQFDRILIDVPCSASGVIRRNPDIKIHRKKTDIPELVRLQQQILNKTWQLLKPGGRLVYATCSIFKDENQSQIDKFLAQHDAQVVSLESSVDTQMNDLASLGYQIFPGDAEMDGFYLCGLLKPWE